MSGRIFHPTSVEEALELLATHEDARCLAGGATLVAMMNARLVTPGALVSLNRIEDLRSIRTAPGGLAVGAMTRHAETAAESRLTGGLAVLREAARQIANPVVRNMGTMGGSISFADPAADYPPALVAAGAEIEIASRSGRRRVAVSEFFVDWYQTALEPGEIVTNIFLPDVPERSFGRYRKLARVAGDYAIASVAAFVAYDNNMNVTELRIAVGGCGPRPVRAPEAELALNGVPLREIDSRELGQALAKACDPVDDVRASASYRRTVVPRMVEFATRDFTNTLVLGA
jgi:carbon-monoxide dehydrogenase medium subunit